MKLQNKIAGIRVNEAGGSCLEIKRALVQPKISAEPQVTAFVLCVLFSIPATLGANPSSKEKVLVFPNEHSYGTLSKITSMRAIGTASTEGATRRS